MSKPLSGPVGYYALCQEIGLDWTDLQSWRHTLRRSTLVENWKAEQRRGSVSRGRLEDRP